MAKARRSTLQIGENSVTLRMLGTTHATVANILGRAERDGLEHIWLDRLIHGPSTPDPEGWIFSGAITSILVADPGETSPIVR